MGLHVFRAIGAGGLVQIISIGKSFSNSCDPVQHQTHLFIVNAHKEKEGCIPPVYNLHIPVLCEGALQMQACTSQSPGNI